LKKAFLFLFTFFLLSLSSMPANAQCSMCRRVAETNHESHSNKVGRSLNSGILYLLAVPYLIGAIGAIYWWKNRKSE